MKIYNVLPNFAVEKHKVAVAIGTFDGIHIGHQKVITNAVELAKASDGCSAVFTFNNHPLSTLEPDKCPPQILSQHDKQVLIESLGVDYLISVDFTKEFLRLSPEDFINMLRVNILPNYIVVGSNFFYGYKSAGSVQTLSEAGKKYGFGVRVIDEVHVNGMVVSSTLIRNLIHDGDVKTAAAFLGRYFKIRGLVIKGDERGRKLGFPTANMRSYDNIIIPGNGVYAVCVIINGRQHYGICNIGPLPTFNIDAQRIEVHLLNFSQDIYGQELTLTFIDKLRDIQKFHCVEQLKQQLAKDAEHAGKIFCL